MGDKSRSRVVGMSIFTAGEGVCGGGMTRGRRELH